jgi:putative SOS response-associated peptidase YedK
MLGVPLCERVNQITFHNAVTSAAHDRTPVILDPDSYDLWLDPGMRDVSAARRRHSESTNYIAALVGRD